MHDSAAMREVFKTSGILDIQMLVRTEIELPEHIASMAPPFTNQENPIVSNRAIDPKVIWIVFKVFDRITACLQRSKQAIMLL